MNLYEFILAIILIGPSITIVDKNGKIRFWFRGALLFIVEKFVEDMKG